MLVVDLLAPILAHPRPDDDAVVPHEPATAVRRHRADRRAGAVDEAGGVEVVEAHIDEEGGGVEAGGVERGEVLGEVGLGCRREWVDVLYVVEGHF